MLLGNVWHSPSHTLSDRVEILQTVQHCHSERKGRAKSNDDRAEKGPGNGPGGIGALFCQVYGAINAGVHEIRIGHCRCENNEA